MAATCSFAYEKANGKMDIIRNSACFATLNRNARDSSIKQYIIIEAEKGPFSHEEKVQYLRDLKSMGFNFYYRTNKDKEIHIFTENIHPNKKHGKVLFGMYVRYLWEGYGEEYHPYRDSNYDNFYTIIPIFNKFKTLLPNCNKFILLNMIGSIYSCFGAFNDNHFPSNKRCGIIPFKNIPFDELNNYRNINLVMSLDIEMSKDIYNKSKEYFPDYYKVNEFKEDIVVEEKVVKEFYNFYKNL